VVTATANTGASSTALAGANGGGAEANGLAGGAGGAGGVSVAGAGGIGAEGELGEMLAFLVSITGEKMEYRLVVRSIYEVEDACLLGNQRGQFGQNQTRYRE
jgi:hypothetical protein